MMFDRTIFMIVMSWSSTTHNSMITCDSASTRDAKSILFSFYHSGTRVIFSLGLMISGRTRLLPNINEHTNETCYTLS